MRTIIPSLTLAVGLTTMAACHKSEPEAAEPTPSIQQQRMARAAEVPQSTQAVWTYLNRLRQGDAYNGMISRTMVNEQNQIGVVLYSQVTPAQVAPLMQKVMQEMAKEFPQRDLTILVFGESSPPHQLGSAHLDGKTGQGSFTPLAAEGASPSPA